MDEAPPEVLEDAPPMDDAPPKEDIGNDERLDLTEDGIDTSLIAEGPSDKLDPDELMAVLVRCHIDLCIVSYGFRYCNCEYPLVPYIVSIVVCRQSLEYFHCISYL